MRRAMIRSGMALVVFVSVSMLMVSAWSSAGGDTTPSLSLSASTIGWQGGQVALHVDAASNGACSVSVAPPLEGLPKRFSSCSDSFRRSVVLSRTWATLPTTYTFTLRGSTGAVLATASLTQSNEPRIAFFGDSFGWQALPSMFSDVAASNEALFSWSALPGTTMCNAVGPVKETAEQEHPAFVILEYYGTAFVPCAQTVSPYPSKAWFEWYASVTTKVVDEALAGNPNATVYLVDGPTAPTPNTFQPKIQQLYQSVADTIDAHDTANPHAVQYLDAGLAVEGPNGGFVHSLPCLAQEVAQGHCASGSSRIAVRGGPFDVHFCGLVSSTGVLDPPGCPKYNSGAYRYGTAMVIPALRAIGTSNLPEDTPWSPTS